jgi:8-oxo-dGTP pyrophosphatase MutT (NUDIX family)
MDLDIIEYLERRLEEDLPGENSHLKMSPIPELRYDVPDDHKLGCVLILIYPRNNDWNLLLVKRAQSETDNHSAQISFPGGRFEETDYSYSDCALRETYEEVGLDPSLVGIIGELSSIYVYASNFLVYPFLGFTSIEPEFTPDANEVEYILNVSLEELMDQKILKRKSITLFNGVTVDNVPYFNLNNEVVWGATAMILAELKDILADADFY